MDESSLRARIANVRERIAASQERAGQRGSVTLVAVTKTYPAEVIRVARAAGLSDIGENRVAELEEKVAEVGRNSVRWHLVGRLQRNKVKRAIELFDLLHSLDSLRLAQKLSDEAVAADREVAALVQVNTSGEEAKTGFDAAAAIDALGEICELPGLRIVGLMTMAPFTDEEPVLRRTFREARRLWEEASRQIPAFEPLHLSMGMSNDFEIAVEEGSTLIRVGTLLFGEREQ